MITRLLENRFVRFLLVGVVNTIFGYSAFALFSFIGLKYPIALALATIAGILFNFKTIGVIVFRSKDNSLIYKFFLVYSVTYVINVFALKWLGSYNLNHYVGQAILAFPVAIISFILNQAFVFTDKAKIKKSTD